MGAGGHVHREHTMLEHQGDCMTDSVTHTHTHDSQTYTWCVMNQGAQNTHTQTKTHTVKHPGLMFLTHRIFMLFLTAVIGAKANIAYSGHHIMVV